MGLLFLLAIGAVLWIVTGTLAILHRLTHPLRMTYGVAVAHQWPTSPQDVGLDFTEAIASLRDHQTTPVWIAQGKKSDGPTLVLTHGWGHSRFGILTWMELLSPYASTLIAYDLRGQGESSAPKSTLGVKEVDDLLEIVRQFAPPGRPVVLAGQSMGGGISIAAGAKAEEELGIAGVLVEGVYRLGMQPVEGFFRTHGLPLWPFYLLVAGHLSFWYTSARKFDRAIHASRLRCPLLALHGHEDTICPMPAAKEIVEAAGAGGRLITFEQGEHLNLAEVDRSRYLDALDTFFAQLSTTKTFKQEPAV